MKRLVCVFVFLVAGCFYQGVKGVYYVTMETEPLDVDGDGIQDGVTVFLLFRDRDFSVVSFYDAECTAVVRVYDEDGLVFEKEVSFDSSVLVGEAGGGIPVVVPEDENGSMYGDITVVVIIGGRGEFRTEKKNVRLR